MRNACTHARHPSVKGGMLMVTLRGMAYTHSAVMPGVMPSVYSTVRCIACDCQWRTKAAYVGRLPNAPRNWWRKSRKQLAAWWQRLPKATREKAHAGREA